MPDKIIHKIVDFQFKMVEVQFSLKDIVDEKILTIKDGKKDKKVHWYEYFKFKDYEQYSLWKNWALEELKKEGRENEIDEIDLLYGMNHVLKETKQEIKKGQQLSLTL